MHPSPDHACKDRSFDWLAVPVGLVVILAGLSFVVFGGSYAEGTIGVLPVDPSSVVLFCTALGTLLAGCWLLIDRPSNEHVLRLLFWWVGAMALTFFMSTALIQNQSQQGVTIVAPTFVRVNSLTVGSTGGLLVGYLYTKAKRNAIALEAEHDRLLREQERVHLLHRIIHHDIRNDMTVVLGWAELLAEELDGEQRAVVDRIRSASKHVVDLTELSRNYLAVVVDEESMELQPTDVVEVLRMELRTCRDAYPEAEFTLRTEAPFEMVEANELLNSVFRNILNNAVQHNDAAAPEIDVSITSREAIVRITIADNGPGISNEQRDLVFGKGERGVESEGTGTGLYLVDVLVEAYGGSVWIEGNDSTGSDVVIELPRAAGDSETVGKSSTEEPC